MFRTFELQWRKRQLDRTYKPLLDIETTSKRQEEILREYTDELNELSTQDKLHRQSKARRKADRIGLPVPAITDEKGNITSAWERDCAGRPLMKDEALYELEQKLRQEQRIYRTELVQWGKLVLMVTSLLLLGPSVSFTRGNEAQQRMDMDQVQVSVRYDLEKCQGRIEPHGNGFQMLQALEEAKKRPLLMSIHNRSQRVSNKVKWSLAVHRKGHSDDLTGYDDLPHHQQVEFKRSNAYANDKILRPGESDEQCYILPKMSGGYPPKELAYTVKTKTVDFAE